MLSSLDGASKSCDAVIMMAWELPRLKHDLAFPLEDLQGPLLDIANEASPTSKHSILLFTIMDERLALFWPEAQNLEILSPGPAT